MESIIVVLIILSLVSIVFSGLCLWCILEVDGYLRDKLFDINSNVKDLLAIKGKKK